MEAGATPGAESGRWRSKGRRAQRTRPKPRRRLNCARVSNAAKLWRLDGMCHKMPLLVHSIPLLGDGTCGSVSAHLHDHPPPAHPRGRPTPYPPPHSPSQSPLPPRSPPQPAAAAPAWAAAPGRPWVPWSSRRVRGSGGCTQALRRTRPPPRPPAGKDWSGARPAGEGLSFRGPGSQPGVTATCGALPSHLATGGERNSPDSPGFRFSGDRAPC